MSKKNNTITQFFKPSGEISTTQIPDIGTSFSPVEKDVSSTSTTSDIHPNGLHTTTLVTPKAFHPDHNFKFPTTTKGKQKRSCQWQWFEKYPWLDYSMEKDSITCFVCRKQNAQKNLISEHCEELAFL